MSFSSIKKRKSFLTTELTLSLKKKAPGTRDLMVFCRQFAALTGAGVSYLRSLQLLGELTEHGLLGEKIREAASRLEEGYSLVESLRSGSDLFPPLLINMIEAGEAGGFLDATLERLALYFEKQYELEQKIRSSTLYPKFIACAAIIAAVFMVSAVLPAFAGIFENMGISMPALTRLLISAGTWLSSCWPIIVMVIVAVFSLGRRVLKTEQGRRFYDRLRLNNPFLGAVYRKMITARFCRTLGTLLGNGTAMLTALDLVKGIEDNSIYADIISRTKEGIIRGQSLAGSLAAVDFFPPLVVEMCSVGEQTGNMEGMLASTASFFETEVSHIIERLCALLEPVLILFMAGIIVFIALSVLLPMFEVYQTI